MQTRTLRFATATVVALVVLVGCGPMPKVAPPTATTPATVGESGDASPSPQASPEPGSLTFGELADGIGAAWPAVESYQITFIGNALTASGESGTPVPRTIATPGATPVSRSRDAYSTVREVALPDRQRQTVTGLGLDDHEAIAIGDTLYVRGPLVERIAPGTSDSAWVEVDPAALPEGALLLHLLGGLPELPGVPLATLPERLRGQEVREVETVEYDGRACQVFAAADTVPATGMRVDYTIAIDDADLPCFVETGAGGEIQGRDEYSNFNEEVDIAAPAATPVSIPPALATPIAHD